MKNVLLFTVALLATISTYGQLKVGNVNLDFGPTIESQKESIIHIAGTENGTIYTLALKKKAYFIQSYDEGSQELKKSVEIDLDKIDNRRVDVEDFVLIDGKLYLMASFYNRKANVNNFVAYPVNEDLKLGKYKKLLAVKVPKDSQRGAFFFKPSYDDINYLVMHIGIFEKEENLKYTINLLDRELNLVHEEKVSTSFEDRKDLEYEVSDFDVNSNGDIFIVINESYRDKKNKTMVNNLSLHTYYAGKGYAKEDVNISLDGKKVVNCNLISTRDGRLHLVGFFSDLRKSGRAEFGLEGIFDVAVDTETNAVVKETFNDFTFETKKKLIGERRAKKDKDLKPYYRNTHLIEKDNGGILILSEYYLRVVGNTSGIGPLAFTPITYITNEIIVTSLNDDGTLEWSNVIPKEQQVTVTQFSVGLAGSGSNGSVSVSVGLLFPIAVLGSGPEFLSGLPMYENGKLSVIINDDPKNIGITDIDDVKKVRNVNKMIPVIFEFDEAGKMTRIDPDDFERKQIVVRPSVYYRVSNEEYIIYGSNKEGERLGTLKID